MPAMANPEITFEAGLDADSLFPHVLQDVSAGKQLYLFGRYHNAGDFDVSLSGRVASGDTTMLFPDLHFPGQVLGSEFVPRMWAKALIDYWVRWMKINGKNQEIVDMIIEMSIEFGVLSPFTSFEQPEEGIGDAPRIASFDALCSSDGLELSWNVTNTQTVLGYNVLRSFSPAGPWRRLNDRLLTTNRFIDQTAPAVPVVYYKIEIMKTDGETIFLSEAFRVGILPTELTLDGIYPNPFNSTTKVAFSLPTASKVTISLFDLQGRELYVQPLGEMTSGVHQVTLQTDQSGLTAGTYFLRLTSDTESKAMKVVLLR
jgi:hypothetical protein